MGIQMTFSPNVPHLFTASQRFVRPQYCDTENPYPDGYKNIENGFGERHLLRVFDQDVAGDFGVSETKISVEVGNGHFVDGNVIAKRITAESLNIEAGCSIDDLVGLEAKASFRDPAIGLNRLDRIIGIHAVAEVGDIDPGAVANAAIGLLVTSKKVGAGSAMDPGVGYGIVIEDVTSSDLLNIALKTGYGAVIFGDVVQCASRVECPSLLVTAGAGADPDIRLDAKVGRSPIIGFKKEGAHRWTFFMDASAESGGNAGSALLIRAFSDGGVQIDTPVTINRAAGSAIVLGRPVQVGYNSATLTVGNGVGSAEVYIRGAAGSSRNLVIRSGTTNRWIVTGNGNPESGADAGTNLEINAHSDAGALIDTPISITRAAGGTIKLGRQLETIAANETTGATAVVLGNNSPATMAGSAPYRWLRFKASDGTPVFVPSWK